MIIALSCFVLSLFPVFPTAPEGNGSPLLRLSIHPLTGLLSCVYVCVWTEASFSSFLPFSERASLVKNGARDPEVSCPSAPARFGLLRSPAISFRTSRFHFYPHPHFLFFFLTGGFSRGVLANTGRSWRGFC